MCKESKNIKSMFFIYISMELPNEEHSKDDENMDRERQEYLLTIIQQLIIVLLMPVKWIVLNILINIYFCIHIQFTVFAFNIENYYY